MLTGTRSLLTAALMLLLSLVGGGRAGEAAERKAADGPIMASQPLSIAAAEHVGETASSEQVPRIDRHAGDRAADWAVQIAVDGAVSVLRRGSAGGPRAP